MSDQSPLDDRAPKLMKRTPEIEISIGVRLKALRIAAGMSQSALGNSIGISFQQIQKYEKGKDRISASTLQILAEVLKVHPGYFFGDDVSMPVGETPDVRVAMRGAAGLQRISNVGVRSRLITLIDALADQTDGRNPTLSQEGETPA